MTIPVWQFRDTSNNMQQPVPHVWLALHPFGQRDESLFVSHLLPTFAVDPCWGCHILRLSASAEVAGPLKFSAKPFGVQRATFGNMTNIGSLTSPKSYGCVWKCCVPHCSQWFADHYPYEKWLFHWEYTPFSDIPKWPADPISCTCGRKYQEISPSCVVWRGWHRRKGGSMAGQCFKMFQVIGSVLGKILTGNHGFYHQR